MFFTAVLLIHSFVTMKSAQSSENSAWLRISIQAGKVNHRYFHILARKNRKESSAFVINRTIFGNQNSALDSGPCVLPNHSYTTSPVISATYKVQGVAVPAVRCLGKKGTAVAGIHCTCQFHKTKIRQVYSVYRVVFIFPLLSPFFSLWIPYIPFSPSIYFLLALVLSCHSDRYTGIRIGASQIITFEISADKEARIITWVECTVSYCCKYKQQSLSCFD